jgi:pyrroline-5-carboxylate reductase
VAKALAPLLSTEHVVVSIMAGVRLATLRAMLGPTCRLVRVMPNAALMVGHGASAFAVDGSATPDDVAMTRLMFSTSGYCAEVSESMLDAVTGLAGSGPAYVAVFVEALADGGVRMGLPRPLARDLAVHTVLGSGKMLLSPQYTSPALLKDIVGSPGGTTMAGLAALEEHRLRFAAIEAVRAATQRAQELAKL